MAQVLNMPKFWLWESSGYGRVLNMRALHSVLNMPEYALTEFWIYLGSKYARILNMQELHRVLDMPQYRWVCLNGTWICLNMSIFWIIDRTLMYHPIRSARSLYKLMNTCWEINLFRTCSKIWDGALWKNSILNLWEVSEYVSGFKIQNICKFS